MYLRQGVMWIVRTLEMTDPGFLAGDAIKTQKIWMLWGHVPTMPPGSASVWLASLRLGRSSSLLILNGTVSVQVVHMPDSVSLFKITKHKIAKSVKLGVNVYFSLDKPF